MKLITTLVAFSLAFLSGAAQADDWPRFLGPGGASEARVTLPDRWSIETGENVAWEVDTPDRGISCPIVVDGRVVLTCSGGLDRSRLHVVAYNALSGEQLWRRQFWATGRTNCFRNSAVAANTPASDGKRVFALFSSNDLVCLDLDGSLLWTRALVEDHPGLGNDIGMASSPAAAGGAVVVQCECQQNSFAAGYDAATGRQLWQVERPQSANWSSPVAVNYGEGKVGVVLQSGSDLTLVDSMSGEQVWREEVDCSTVPSAVYDGEFLYVPSRGLTVLDPDQPSPKVVWQSGTLQPGSPSPVVGGGRIYLVNRSGVISCADAQTGEPIWKKRLGGRFWATPVLSDGKLFCINFDGDAFVVSANDGSILSKPKLGQEVYASPAAADGGLFIRTNSKLWKIAIQRQARR